MKSALTLLPIAALVLTACGGDDAAISVDDAWARTSPAGVTVGAAYFDITADDDDVLIGASVAATVAGHVEIHEVVPADEASDDMSDDADHDDHDMSGDADDEMSGEHDDHGGDGEMQMVMRQLDDGLALPAGETVTLEPGGYHVMLLDLATPLATGDEFDLTLDFETADDLTITVVVAETAP